MEMSFMESLFLGLMAIGIIFWMKPGIKNSIQIGKNADSDWMGLMLPLGFVLIFVVFLIAMV